MKVTVNEAKKTLIIEIPMFSPPVPSKSSGGRNLNVASTGGFTVTDCMIQGKALKVNVNAIIPAQ